MTNQINFLKSIRLNLAASFDEQTADYLIDESRRIAAYALNDDEFKLDPTIADDLIMLHDTTQQMLEPATIFNPIPASCTDFDELALIALFSTILEMLIDYFLFNPDA